jgi:hypothetical protein
VLYLEVGSRAVFGTPAARRPVSMVRGKLISLIEDPRAAIG